MLNKKIILLILISSSILFGSEIKDINSNTIIIYNDLALINNKGKIKVDNNLSELSIPNVSSNLISDSVSININEPNINILEQNYRYDILNFNSILKHNLNKNIYYKEQEYSLLSINNGCVVKNKLTNLISNINCDSLIVKSLPENVISEPSLYWKLNNLNKDIETNFDLSYLSNGFSWNSNYVANIQQDKIFLNGWINLNNNSDTNLNDYKLILLAGKPNVVNENIIQPMNMVRAKMMMEDVAFSKPIEEQSFSGYHIYKIPLKVDIPKQSNKQISFFNKTINNFDLEYKIDLSNFETREKLKFDKFISFYNKNENGLGIPLPSGKIRFYEKDSENINYFIGENKIEDTPKNELINLKIGQDFDSILNVKLLDKVYDNKKQLYTVEYTIKNNSDIDKTYLIKQFNPIYNIEKNKIDIQSTCNNNCTYVFDDIRYLTYKIKLNKNAEYSFKTTLKD